MNRDPIRLRHDPAILPALRDDLALARKGARAPYDEAAGLARLQASLGGSPGGGSPPPGPAASGLLQAIPWGSAVIGAGFAVVALVLWSLLVPAAPSSPAAAPSGTVSTAAATPPTAPLASSIPVLEAQGSSSPRAPGAPPRPASPITPRSPQNEARIDAPAPSAGPAASAPSVSSKATLAEEVAHLERMRALAVSDPTSAPAFAEEGHRRFTGGALWLERESLAIDALVRVGRREEAATRGARLLERYPDSPVAERIRRLLGQSPHR